MSIWDTGSEHGLCFLNYTMRMTVFFLTELMSGLSEIIYKMCLAESINGSSYYFETINIIRKFAQQIGRHQIRYPWSLSQT